MKIKIITAIFMAIFGIGISAVPSSSNAQMQADMGMAPYSSMQQQIPNGSSIDTSQMMMGSQMTGQNRQTQPQTSQQQNQMTPIAQVQGGFNGNMTISGIDNGTSATTTSTTTPSTGEVPTLQITGRIQAQILVPSELLSGINNSASTASTLTNTTSVTDMTQSPTNAQQTVPAIESQTMYNPALYSSMYSNPALYGSMYRNPALYGTGSTPLGSMYRNSMLYR